VRCTSVVGLGRTGGGSGRLRLRPGHVVEERWPQADDGPPLSHPLRLHVRRVSRCPILSASPGAQPFATVYLGLRPTPCRTRHSCAGRRRRWRLADRSPRYTPPEPPAPCLSAPAHGRPEPSPPPPRPSTCGGSWRSSTRRSRWTPRSRRRAGGTPTQASSSTSSIVSSTADGRLSVRSISPRLDLSCVCTIRLHGRWVVCQELGVTCQ